ncbi:protein kinase [Streptomyces sp. NPDC002734]|uniref:serine/threonine-protein kinase n=1 Tax=Streptomyces sp. NPDC002734 TaxID=3154426 RepID=UPI00331DF49B
MPTAQASADPWTTHLLCDRYQLEEKIGMGGMADVYKGVDTRLQRPVAVKVFRPGAHHQAEDCLAAEAVLLAGLQGPGLVTVYDMGRHDGRAFLVMELVDGPTLRDLLEGGALPQRRVAELGAALAQALAHVHRSGIVHRDVKPSNVLLDTAAGAPHLADFGIARFVDATRHTAPDALTGTAAYLAPEQVEGKSIGPATDVYALGLVLLECVKGRTEYQGTPLEAAIARLHRPPLIPTWLSPDLVALIRAMTHLDPAARPDAAHCAKTLAALAAGGSPDAAPLPVPPSTDLVFPVRSAEPDAAVTRSAPLPAGPRHGRRVAVGTVLAALSVALGATVALAPDTSGNNDDTRASATAPQAQRPSGKASAEDTAADSTGDSDRVPPTVSYAVPAANPMGSTGRKARTGKAAAADREADGRHGKKADPAEAGKTEKGGKGGKSGNGAPGDEGGGAAEPPTAPSTAPTPADEPAETQPTTPGGPDRTEQSDPATPQEGTG